MELVIKLYSDKPSRIGIRYIYEYLAIREYEQLMSKFKGETFSINIEFVKDKLDLTLHADSSGGKTVYKALEFKMDQLRKLQAFFNATQKIEFVHVFPKSNTLLIAKAYRASEFFTVSSIDFIGLAGANY